MKAYGVKNKDRGCCPGHNKFSDHSYNNRRSIKAKSRDTKYAHGRERNNSRLAIHRIIKLIGEAPVLYSKIN